MKDVTLAFLKTRLNTLNKEIQELELKALIFSDRDREVVKECDIKIAKLNAEWLDIDEQIQQMETKVA
jgi:hypothetical protein